MQPLTKRLTVLLEQINAAFLKLDIAGKKEIIANLKNELSDSDVWNNPINAQAKSKQLSALSSSVEPWDILKVQVEDMFELIKMGDSSLITEFEQQVDALEKNYQKLKKDLIDVEIVFLCQLIRPVQLLSEQYF